MQATRINAAVLMWLLAGASLAAHNPPISADRLAEQLGDDARPLILDVRTDREYEAGHVPGALHIPHTRLAERLSDVPAGSEDGIVVYCEQGPRATAAENILEEAGFTEVRTLEGHMSNWRSEGYPME